MREVELGLLQYVTLIIDEQFSNYNLERAGKRRRQIEIDDLNIDLDNNDHVTLPALYVGRRSPVCS